MINTEQKWYVKIHNAVIIFFSRITNLGLQQIFLMNLIFYNLLMKICIIKSFLIVSLSGLCLNLYLFFISILKDFRVSPI